ncbi:hypothetical protein LTR93_011934 [Exophiala xenobiotica]|nr:hypothetical protein LTR93_011934 [Exophiala xenobiotica]
MSVELVCKIDFDFERVLTITLISTDSRLGAELQVESDHKDAIKSSQHRNTCARDEMALAHLQYMSQHKELTIKLGFTSARTFISFSSSFHFLLGFLLSLLILKGRHRHTAPEFPCDECHIQVLISLSFCGARPRTNAIARQLQIVREIDRDPRPRRAQTSPSCQVIILFCRPLNSLPLLRSRFTFASPPIVAARVDPVPSPSPPGPVSSQIFHIASTARHCGREEPTTVGERLDGDVGQAGQLDTASKAQAADCDKNIKIRANYGGSGMKALRLTFADSLRRLQTNYVDILCLHWWNSATIPEVMHGLNDLVVSGKVLYLGISDSPAWLFVVYQGIWSAAMRDLERDIVPMCRDEGMSICPYSVLNTGTLQSAAAFEERKKNNTGRQFPVTARDKDMSRVLEAIADTKKTTLTNVALAYVMHKEPYVYPIVGGGKISHIKGSIEGISTSLSAEEMDQIDKAYDFDPGFPYTFLSGTMIQEFDMPQNGASRASEVCWTMAQGTFDWVESPKAVKVAPYGCTSGHGLSGLSSLSFSSLVTVVAMFGAGITTQMLRT